jgi:hypothetical protein
MTGEVLPDPDECILCRCVHLNPPEDQGCDHACIADVDTKTLLSSRIAYTSGLREVVGRLLQLNRKQSRAILLYQLALRKYLVWKQETVEGRMYKDEVDARRETQE